MSEPAQMETTTLAQNRSDRLERLERITELPLMLSSFALIPIITGLYLWDLSPLETRIYSQAQIAVWVLFAVALLAKIAVAPNKLQYIRKNWLEVLLVVIPVIRPLRILRAFIWIARDIRRMNRLVTIESLLAYGIGTVLLAATVVTTAERTADGANILSFPDALYWSFVTVSTVGYGDHFPVTVVGKFTAVFLMFFGIGIFGATAGKIFAALSKSA